jgi:inner membrane protein
MPTIMTHAVVPIAIGFALGRGRIAKSVVVAGAVLAMLPDADVIGFALGIDYADQLGHRGASHALLVAAGVAAVVTAAMRPARAALAFAFLFASMASHGLLDALTNGGLGPALFWPFDHARYFWPATPIKVSPIGAGFFSARGVAVLLSEAVWVWLPAIGVALLGRVALRPKDRI